MKKSIRPYNSEPWEPGSIAFDLGLHETEIVCRPRSERGKSTHKDELYYVMMSVVSVVDAIINNLKVIEK